jgi:antitoxin (DNA-binding transcriptional repressor) of toxin-antitoxin stability system
MKRIARVVRDNNDMAELHMTVAELARDVHAVLEKVRHGAEVIIEQDHRPVAVIKTPHGESASVRLILD